MQVKTFRARSLQEALRQVRLSLGPDAAVLHTREVRHSRLGLFPQSMIEVEASSDTVVASRFASSDHSSAPSNAAHTSGPVMRQNSPPAAPTPRSPAAIQPATGASPHDAARIDAPGPGHSSEPVAENPNRAASTSKLRQAAAESTRVDGDRTAIDALPSNPPSDLPIDLPSNLFVEMLGELVESGFAPATAKELLLSAAQRCRPVDRRDPWLLRVSLCQSIAQRVRTGGSIQVDPDEQQVVAFVGPTGVGKTTTLAKIAAGLRFDLGCQVGLMTLDTFRPGAVDQLLQYAELITATLEVVSTPAEIRPALARLRECDVVLLDTAGRSPRDQSQLQLLSEILQAAEPDATHLVASAHSSPQHLSDLLERFAVVEPTHLLVTKIDEAVQLGSWSAVLFEQTLPISYLGTGQQVPQDLAVASPRRVARDLLGNSSELPQH